jgi:hypothetical protein
MLLPSVRRSASYRIRGLELVGDGIYQHGHHWEGSGEPLCRNPPATQSLVIQSNRRWHRLGTGIGLAGDAREVPDLLGPRTSLRCCPR